MRRRRWNVRLCVGCPISRRLFKEAESEARITALNLLSLRPLIPRQCILLIEAEHDVLAEATEELGQKWKQAEIELLPHGHVSWMLVLGLTDCVLERGSIDNSPVVLD
jgi:hypothetical protein